MLVVVTLPAIIYNNLKTTTPVQGLLPKYTSREGGQTVGNWLRKPHRLKGPGGLTDEKTQTKDNEEEGGSDGRGSRGEHACFKVLVDNELILARSEKWR